MTLMFVDLILFAFQRTTVVPTFHQGDNINWLAFWDLIYHTIDRKVKWKNYTLFYLNLRKIKLDNNKNTPPFSNIIS